MSKQWFVTMEPLAEKALHAVENGELTILPERFEKVLICIFSFFLVGLFNCFTKRNIEPVQCLKGYFLVPFFFFIF